MKRIMMFLAVSAAALSGCVKENPAGNADASGNPTNTDKGPGIRTIRVAAGGDQSRVGVNINRPDPDTYYWTAGDEVILCEVVAGAFTGNNYRFTLDAGSENQAEGAFTLAADELAAPAPGTYVAVHVGYETNLALPVADGALSYWIPSTPTQDAGAADVAQYMLLAAPVTLTSDGTIPDVTLEHKTAVVELGITASDTGLQGATLTGVTMEATTSDQYAEEIALSPSGVATAASGRTTNTVAVSGPNTTLDASDPCYVRMVTLMDAPAAGNVTFTFTAQSGTNDYVSQITLPSITLNAGSVRPATIDLSSHAVGIYTAAQLNNVRNNRSGNYILMNDIDLSADYPEWTPIGNGTGSFSGQFDGNGHKITGLSITSNPAFSGLFGMISGGSVSNLGVEITASGVNGNTFAGGITGHLNTGGTISNCYATGNISVSGTSDAYSGGIAGYVDSNSTITNCYTTGDISSSSSLSSVDSGGIAGYVSSSTITDCYSMGKISVSGLYNPAAGGIAGWVTTNSTVTGCAAINNPNPAIDAGAGYAGRVAGYVDGTSTVSNNFALSSMSLTGNSTQSNSGTNTAAGDFLLQSTYSDPVGGSGGPAGAGGLGWAFGSDDTAPWKMGAAGYPVLYWQ